MAGTACHAVRSTTLLGLTQVLGSNLVRSMAGHTAKSWIAQLLLWLAILIGVAGALWFANLYVFHSWAAYAPPQETALHLRRARVSAVLCLVSFGVSCLSAWGVIAIRGRHRQSAA